MNRALIGSWARWLLAGAVILVLLVLLVAGGLCGVAVRTYALRAPNQFPLLTLSNGRTVCEGPVRSSWRFRAVAFWGAATGPAARLRVTVRAAGGGRVIASGALAARNAEEEQRAQLGAAVPGRTPVRICVSDVGGRFSIAGGQSVHSDVVMPAAPHRQFSLLLLGGRQSLFSALTIAFSRAALFRADWVGAWTFWVLAGGLLAAFALASVAVVRAIEADGEDGPRGPDAGETV